MAGSRSREMKGLLHATESLWQSSPALFTVLLLLLSTSDSSQSSQPISNCRSYFLPLRLKQWETQLKLIAHGKWESHHTALGGISWQSSGEGQWMCINAADLNNDPGQKWNKADNFWGAPVCVLFPQTLSLLLKWNKNVLPLFPFSFGLVLVFTVQVSYVCSTYLLL